MIPLLVMFVAGLFAGVILMSVAGYLQDKIDYRQAFADGYSKGYLRALDIAKREADNLV